MLREIDLLIYFLLPWQLGHYAEIFKSYVRTGSLWIPFQNHKRGIRNICSNKRAANLIVLETAYVDSILWHESVKMNQSPELISLILLHTAGLQPTVSRAFLPYTLPSFDKDGLPEFFHLLTYVMNCSTFHLCLEENERGEGIHLRPTMLSEGFQIQIFFFFF